MTPPPGPPYAGPVACQQDALRRPHAARFRTTDQGSGVIRQRLKQRAYRQWPDAMVASQTNANCQEKKTGSQQGEEETKSTQRRNAGQMASIFLSTQSGLPRGLKRVLEANLLNCINRWWPYQPHPGTRVPRLGCYLPVLTRLTSYQCERTNGTTGEENRQTGLPMQWLSARRRTVRLIFQQSAEWIS